MGIHALGTSALGAPQTAQVGDPYGLSQGTSTATGQGMSIAASAGAAAGAAAASGQGIWNVVGVGSSAAAAAGSGSGFVSTLPVSDVSAGSWTQSAGGTLAGVLDEVLFNDGDYANVSANSAMRVALAAVATPSGGTRTLRYRASGRPDKRLIARLIEGTTTLETWTTDPLGAMTLYERTVTASVSDYSSLRVEFEAADATSFTAPVVSFGSAGAVAYSAAAGSSVAPAYPASISVGHMLILVVGQKPSAANSGTCSTPSGWSLVGSITGQGGYATTLGADTGNTNLFVFSKTADGSESGTLSVTVGTNGVCWATIIRLTQNITANAWSTALGTGSDSSAGNVSITMGSNPGVQAGDFVIGAMCIPTDVTTPAQFSAEAFSQTGVTFGTVIELSEPDSSNGNDIGGFVCYAQVSSGTGSAAPVMTATAGGTTTNVRGPGIFLRVRTAYSGEFARVSWAQLQVPGSVSTYLGSSVGGSSVLGAGQSLSLALGAAAATSAGAAAGQALGTATGSSTAAAAAAASGQPLATATGASTASSTAAGAGQTAFVGQGSSAASSSAVGAGFSAATGDGAVAGSSTAAGQGRAQTLALASSAAAGAAAAQGGALAVATATASAAASAAAVGAPLAAGNGTSTAGSSASGQGIANSGTPLGFSAGASSASGQGIALSVATGSAAAAAAASGQGRAIALSQASAAGTSVSTGSGAALAMSLGTIAAAAGAAAQGGALARGAATSSGSSVAAASGTPTFSGLGQALGTATATAVGSSRAAGLGTSASGGAASALGVTVFRGVGLSAGSSTATAKPVGGHDFIRDISVLHVGQQIYVTRTSTEITTTQQPDLMVSAGPSPDRTIYAVS